ncbi:MAG: PilN domain-containing protein [Candidatus Pacebacteria bacterium]|nr:PilN domain-containing protein [Candidatus Paceibacterota bacterium]
MINLLPPQQKRDLLREERFKLILILGILLLIFLILFSLILLSIKIYISGQAESQKSLANLGEKELPQFNALKEKLNSINQDLSKVDSFYEGQFHLTEFLERISKITPEGIYLKSFSYQKDTSQITFSGFSPTVEVLVDFKENLEKQENFKEIRFSPTAWIKLVDIDFDVTFKITE